MNASSPTTHQSSEPGDLQLVAATTFGVESVVKRELEDLGYETEGRSTGRVAFRGGSDALARACLWLRAADRVLVQVGQFDAPDFDALFEGVGSIDWARYIDARGAFPVNARTRKSRLTSVPAIQRSAKRAIVDRLTQAFGQELPEDGAPVRISIELADDVATVYLDASGEALHKRGYRDLTGTAPLRETLAAALLMLSVWEPSRPLIDPFCGSGTIAIEAAMIARRLAPGRHRSFDAEGWAWIPRGVWERARADADSAAVERAPAPIVGTDRDAAALSLARRHAERAGVANDCHFQQRDVADLAARPSHGVVVTNPPYGRRLDDERVVRRLYRTLPGVFSRLPTWSFAVLTASKTFEDDVERPADKRRKLFNARVETTLYQFLGPRRDAGSSGNAAFQGSARSLPPSAEDLLNRVAKQAHHLRRWPDRRGVNAYRVYDHDMPEWPVVVERYAELTHVRHAGRPRGVSESEWAAWITELAPRVAERIGLEPDRVHALGPGVRTRPQRAVIEEAGLRMPVAFDRDLGAAPRLDHRLLRSELASKARDKRVLVLGDRSGSLAAAAVAGGGGGVWTDCADEDLIRAILEASGHPARRAWHRVPHIGATDDDRRPATEWPTVDRAIVILPRTGWPLDAVEAFAEATAEGGLMTLVRARAGARHGADGEQGDDLTRAIESIGFVDSTKRTCPEDCPRAHRSWSRRA